MNRGKTTFGTDEAVNLTYRPSEFQAYRSGQSLRNFVGALPGDTHVLAHSMGNVVVAEALRQHAETGPSALVKSYTAVASAMPAGAYGSDNADGFTADGRVSLLVQDRPYQQQVTWTNGNTPNSSSLDLLRYWSTGGASTPGLPGGYYMEGADSAAETWVNVFNPNDYATAFAWRLNNISKPFQNRATPEEPGYIVGAAQIAPGVGPEDFMPPTEIWSHTYLDEVPSPILARRPYTTEGDFDTAPVVSLWPGIYSNGEGSSPGANAYEVLAFLSEHNAAAVGNLNNDAMNEWFNGSADARNDLGVLLSEEDAAAPENHSFHIRHELSRIAPFWQYVAQQSGVSVSG